MKVLLSIKPEFAEKIFSGEKKYEFRRTIFKNKNVKTIVVYASAPVQKIIGEFHIESVLVDEISVLWKKTQDFSGISENYFFDYFRDKSLGYAIKVKKFKKYKKPVCLREKYNLTPPQSFLYLTSTK